MKLTSKPFLTKPINSPRCTDMRPYTVILLYPDYLATTFGQDTCLAWVEGEDRDQAVKNAQIELAKNEGTDEPDDFFAIACFDGYLEELE